MKQQFLYKLTRGWRRRN